MAQIENFTLYRGDDQLLRFTRAYANGAPKNGTVLGWTTVLTVRKTNRSADPPVLSVTGIVVDAGSVSTPGVFTVLLTQAQLLALELRPYVYSFKRTDVGASATMAEGVMTVHSDIEHAA